MHADTDQLIPRHNFSRLSKTPTSSEDIATSLLTGLCKSKTFPVFYAATKFEELIQECHFKLKRLALSLPPGMVRH